MGGYPYHKKPNWTPSEKDLDEIKTLAGYGLSHEKIAAVKGISRSTFEHAMKKNDILRNAMHEGRAMAETVITRCAFQMAKVDPGMTKFWLQCRAKWKPVEVKEITGNEGGPITTQELSAEERKQRVAELKRILDETE